MNGNQTPTRSRRAIRPARARKIDEAATRVAVAERQLLELRRQLDAELWAANEAGAFTVKSLAEAASLSREAVYQAIRREEKRRRPELPL